MQPGSDVLIFLKVFATESGPIAGAENADGLDERGSSSAVLEAPRPPNSLLSISAPVLSPEAALSSNPARETIAGEKRTQLNRCRKLQVNACVYCMRVSLLHACGFLRNRACVLLHALLRSMCYFIWERGSCMCVYGFLYCL